MSRPSSYSEAVAQKILKRLADGESVRKICADDDMPCRDTFNEWCKTNPEFSDHSARAMEDAADVYEDQRKEITQELINSGLSGEDLPRGKVEALKAAAQELARSAANHAPKRYGNKVSIGGDPDNPIKHEVKQELPPLTVEQVLEIARMKYDEDE
jgi:hypothetical protein